MSSTNVPVTQAPPTPAGPETSSDPGQTPVEPATGPAAGPATGAVPSGPSGPSAGASGPAEPDEVAAAAVELARQAAIEIAEPDTVGDHLGVTVDDGGLTMHSFRCTARGYRGWRWAVTLAHVPGSDRVTVCDTVLLPGADSIQAPTWVPWSDRLAPGDLGAGDDLPYRADDPLLVPGYTVTNEDDADQELFWEFGFGRERVVGLAGLQAAAGRWERGPHGPTSELAVQASASCLSCAYLVPVSGFLRRHFGVCTNEWSPADGTVVTTDFGCGAHSETDLELPAPEPLPAHILDETVIEEVSRTEDALESHPDVEDGPAGVENDPAEVAGAPDPQAVVDGALLDLEGATSTPAEPGEDQAAALDLEDALDPQTVIIGTPEAAAEDQVEAVVAAIEDAEPELALTQADEDPPEVPADQGQFEDAGQFEDVGQFKDAGQVEGTEDAGRAEGTEAPPAR